MSLGLSCDVTASLVLRFSVFYIGLAGMPAARGQQSMGMSSMSGWTCTPSADICVEDGLQPSGDMGTAIATVRRRRHGSAHTQT